MTIGAATAAIAGSAPGAASVAFAQLSSTASDRLAGNGATPWDEAGMSIPASGRNGILLDFLCPVDLHSSFPAQGDDILDPAGVAQPLTLADTPLSGGGDVAAAYYMLAASMPASGSYTLRFNVSSAKEGFRQFVVLEGARQAVSYGTAISNTDDNTAITVDVTRNGGGSFPIGSRVYAALVDGETSMNYTVSGDASEVRESDGTTSGDNFVFAAGTLASAKSTVSVTFTPASAVNRRRVTAFVVEPA